VLPAVVLPLLFLLLLLLFLPLRLELGKVWLAAAGHGLNSAIAQNKSSPDFRPRLCC
jgi:hypothetical protein